MIFESPAWLYIAPALALLAGSLIAYGLRQRTQLLQKFAAERLLPRLTEKAPLRRTFIKAAFVVLGVTLIAIALARPQYGVKWSEQKTRGLDIVFALDSSKSMLATDIRPTRLERAKLAIRDLMERLESDRVGLVAFAGQAFLQTPPTLDYSAFRESLEATNPSVLSRGGSDIGRALEEATKAFPTESNVKVVVLLTDGEDLGGQAVEAAREAAENGIQVFTIGIGTPEGTYLRVLNTSGQDEFVRDNEGQPVRSQLDEVTLQEIAEVTGGIYSRLSGGGLDQLYNSVLATLPREERESELKEVRIERFQWFLGAALLFLVLGSLIRRRGRHIGTATIIAACLIATPRPTSAEEVETHSHETLAYEALTAGEFDNAIQHYESSIRETDDLMQQRDALYNMGHAKHQLARQTYKSGDLEAALEQISDAEEYFTSARDIGGPQADIDDDINATIAVKEAIEKLLEQQQQQDQKNQDSQDQEPSEENQNEEQDSEESESGDSSENQEGQEQEDNQGDSSEEQQEESDQNQSETEQDSEGSDNESEQSQGSEGEQSEESGEEQNGQNQETGEEEESQSGTQTEEEQGETSEEGSTEEVPEVSESGEESDAAAGSEAREAVPVQGMSIEQAQDLLDSLREREEILPFNRATPGQGRPLQDW